ncbi:ATP-binding cassette domain-containing protein [Cytophagaceae bacterium YF14B1]|uniref:ATP-binding cassette domain-containing protein n=1 Tax=Xanthocytophaga flava TaxID=3048013 RepID=A0AAE3QJ36_9BACT|nr:AAA family ATPase [Xanthocytophaga flavus]MDJ1480262.1 ATP-binding cassette domain-containing protein [Xanthocytophaga flavus]
MENPPIIIRIEQENDVIEIELSKVTVLIGANGSGKSRLLKRIRDEHQYLLQESASAYNNIIYFEAGRVVNISERVLNYDASMGAPLPDTKNLLSQYNQLGIQGLNQRLFLALQLIIIESEKIMQDRVAELYKERTPGYRTPPEKLRKFELDLPIEKLAKAFNDIFPEIQIEYDIRTKEIKCINGNSRYSPNELSDGEKQVLAIIADIEYWGNKKSIVIVDEPEIFLNPVLACSLWDIIEKRYSDNIYIYATHNVSFMMRQNIQRTYALSRKSRIIQEIKSLTDFPSEDLRLLIGNIPAILSSSKVLLTEGKITSIDVQFYKWLLNKSDLLILPMESCTSVQNGLKGEGIWKALTNDLDIAGIFDRDFKSDELLAKIRKDINCVILDYHEAESYLCHPSIIHRLATVRCQDNQIPSETKILQHIVSCIQNKKNKITRIRTIEKIKPIDSPEIESTNENSLDLNAIIERFNDSTKILLNNYEKQLEQLEQTVTNEYNQCLSAIDKQDIDLILKLFEGKELLTQIKQLAGCSTPELYIQQVFKHFKPEDFPTLFVPLKQQLLMKLNYEPS